MRKYVDVDILAALSAVVDVNTKHYKSDYEYDRKMIFEAARSTEADGNVLLWMSRECGTWCLAERDAFISDTEGHMIWLNHTGEKGVAAFTVELSGIKDGRPTGVLYELDYALHAERVKRAALPAATVTLTFEGGGTKQFPYEQAKGHWESIQHEHGKITASRYDVADGAALQSLLAQERDARCRFPARSFGGCMRRLAANTKPSAVERLAAAKGDVKSPTPASRRARREAEL